MEPHLIGALCPVKQEERHQSSLSSHEHRKGPREDTARRQYLQAPQTPAPTTSSSWTYDLQNLTKYISTA